MPTHPLQRRFGGIGIATIEPDDAKLTIEIL